MEQELQSQIASSDSPSAAFAAQERNWVPVVIAAALVVAVVAAVLVLGRHSRPAQEVAASSAPDPYAPYLPISNVVMSESSNLAGGKVTYVDGRIANQGDRTVTGAVVQVVFLDYKREVAQSQRLPLTVIRMREPYIDTVTLSAAPLKPGSQQDFRLNFDAVSPDWSGALPEIRIVHVDAK